MTELQMYINPTILAMCLLLGSHIKNATRLKNQYIPFVLSIVGSILSIALFGLSVENFIGGMITGLSSTGLNQAYRGLKNDDTKDVDKGL